MGDGNVKKCSKILLRAVNSAKEKKSVLICCSSFSEFQILDLDSGELSKTPFTLLGDAGIGTILSVGSVIYTLGKPRSGSLSPDYSYYFSNCKGENDIVEVHEGMSYFDLSNPQMGWKKGPLFTEDKNFPNCVALCGKLYVFRSSNWSCFGEVFDPNNKTSTWDPLPKPIAFSGRKFKVSPTLVPDPLHARILVHLDLLLPFVPSIYAYYPADATWECLVENFEGNWAGPIVFVDGVIFFYARKSRLLLDAYDLDTKQWLNVVLSSDFEDYSKYVFDALHHLGNDLLCLTTYFYNLKNLDPSIQKDHTVVVFCPIQIPAPSRFQQGASHSSLYQVLCFSILLPNLWSYCYLALSAAMEERLEDVLQVGNWSRINV